MLTFDETALDSYFKDLQGLSLLTASEEVFLATRLKKLKLMVIDMLADKDILKKLLFLPSVLGGIFNGDVSLEDVFEITQAKNDKHIEETKIRRKLNRIIKLPDRKGDKVIKNLPFRWEIVESLISKYCSANKLDKEATAIYEEIKTTREKFINSNLRLVIEMIKKLGISPYGAIPWEDLIQEGNIGLMKAVTKYDPTKGFRFSTYACWWITQSVIRAIADKGRLIRYPVHMQTKELREKNEMPIQIILPLDAPSHKSDDCDLCLADILADKENQSQEHHTVELRTFILEKLQNFPPREEKIIRMYFGLDGKSYTLQEIGSIFDVSRERIRQIRDRLLKKLKVDKAFSGIANELNYDSLDESMLPSITINHEGEI